MQLLGVPLRKPSFQEVTAASVMAIGLWLAGVGAMVQSGQPFDRADLAALLAMTWWGCLGVRLGIDLRAGWRPLLLSTLVAAALLALNGVAWAIAG